MFDFLLFLFLWHPYDSDVVTFKVVPEVLQPLLIFFFFLIVSSFCFGWMFICSFCSKPSSPGFLPFAAVPCVFFSIFFFISLYITLTSYFILWPYSIISVSILITSVLNYASDRLAISPISLLLSSFFSWSFDLFFFKNLFLERMEGERNGEKHQCVVTLY